MYTRCLQTLERGTEFTYIPLKVLICTVSLIPCIPMTSICTRTYFLQDHLWLKSKPDIADHIPGGPDVSVGSFKFNLT